MSSLFERSPVLRGLSALRHNFPRAATALASAALVGYTAFLTCLTVVHFVVQFLSPA
jgi:hypothetical protein